MKMMFRVPLVVLILFGAACERSELPTAPAISPAIPPPTPPGGPAGGAAACAPLTAEAQAAQRTRVFAYSAPFVYPVSAYTIASEFRLYQDGKFALAMPGGAYRGTYTQANGIITFDWEGWSLAGPWGATGTLCGNSLRVEYNVIMMLTDFEDAVYELKE